jgi:hypothetical protein
VGLGRVPGDGQPEADPLRFAGDEWLEQAGGDVGGRTWPRVGYFYDQGRGRGLQRHRHFAPAADRVHRVANEVGEQVAELALIPSDPNIVG